VLATVVPDTKSGTPGADLVKVKGTITWVSAHDGVPVTLNLYDRLFAVPQPGSADSLTAELNPDSIRVVRGFVEPSVGRLPAETRVQFERHGYFVTDRVDHQLDKPVFNRVTTLKDSWGK
jgi:glutaminyl-tRNA synthetase